MLVRKQQELLAGRNGNRVRLFEEVEFQIVRELYLKHLEPLEVKRIQLEFGGDSLAVCAGRLKLWVDDEKPVYGRIKPMRVQTYVGERVWFPVGCGRVFANNRQLVRQLFAYACPECQDSKLRRQAAAAARRFFAPLSP